MNGEFLISEAKRNFNRFFRDDLYGRFEDKNNIILSRGSWNDDFIQFPTFFKFCLNYTLSKKWVGYSNPLGHENVFLSLEKLVNINRTSLKYTHENFGLTLGNTVSVGFIFRELKQQMTDNSEILSFFPYYPPLLKSINYYFPMIYFVSSLKGENEILDEIKEMLNKNKKIKLLFLSNFIGVEGRIFSYKFWEEICEFQQKKELHLVIDEALWFHQLQYPLRINNPFTIRMVSLSKQFGVPGMKVGVILGDKDFISRYYEQASTNYGGPASIFFLLSEFLYLFEYVRLTNDTNRLDDLIKRYSISRNCIKKLYENYVQTVNNNKQNFEKNRGIFIEWVSTNSDLFEDVYIFDGFNFFLRPGLKEVSTYELFLKLIKKHKVSILPGCCLGDYSDSMFRITILEPSEKLRTGLFYLSKFISTLL